MFVSNDHIQYLFRLEKIRLSCVYSKVKIVGTFLCVAGAVLMSLLHSSKSTKDANFLLVSTSDVIFDKQKMIGCFYLMAAVFVLSTNVVLQVKLSVEPLSEEY